MSDSLSDFEDENNWILDLETALLETCDFFKLRSICRDRAVPKHLRSDVWKICLNISNQNNPTNSSDLDSFNDVFDLPNQDILHDCCCEFVATLPKDLFANRIGFINDIESILTFFSRKYSIPFHSNNGWLNILKVLCCELKLNKRDELYQFFTAICHRFLPSSSVINNEVFTVFRLLIQYHDPELCSFLDTHKISPDSYASQWFSALFSSDIQHDALVQLWDAYFLISDPFLMFYLSLIVVLNLKETLLEMRGSDKEVILKTIKSVLQQMSLSDVEDFQHLAQHYVSLTPKSFIRLFSSILFGNGNKDSEIESLLNSLCMPVSVHELLESKTCLNNENIRYFLVDCRPAEQYNNGHLASAYFLDSSLILTSPSEEFQMSATALLATQEKALENGSESAGEHICFLGSGDAENDQIVNMVVAQFLQKVTKYVSLVYGGYRAIHDVLGPQCDSMFVGHNTAACQVCTRVTIGGNRDLLMDNMMDEYTNNNSMKMSGLLSKMSSVLKVNSSKFKDKLTSYVKNGEESKTEHDKSNSRPYRNTGNIFSIEDDGDDEYDSNFVRDSYSNMKQTTKVPEVINLDVLNKRLNGLRYFECYVVDSDGTMHPGYLLLTSETLYVLKKSVTSRVDNLTSFLTANKRVSQQSSTSGSSGNNKNMVLIYHQRPLNSVVKITSRKKLPECLTFHYVMPDDTVEKDRYLINQAGEAAKIIKVQVQKVLDSASGDNEN